MTDQDNADDGTSDDAEPGRRAMTAQRQNQMVRRDFSGTSMSMTSASTEALVASSRANTEASWIMAMQNRRDIDTVRVDVLAECKRPGFAEVATYARPVGKEKDEKTGEWIDVFAEGLSIRFAEVAMRCMGNMRCKATTLYDDAKTRMITVTAVDFETNATWDIDLTINKTVERRSLRKGQRPLGERVNSYGDRVYIVEATDQQVATTCAAEISKASRTAILRLIPGHIQDEAFELCRKVAADKAAKDPKANKNRMLDGFAELGVRPAAIVEWLGHEIDSSSRDEFIALSRIASGIRERELVWSEVLAERLAERAKQPAKQPAAAAPPAEPATTAGPAPATQPDAPAPPPRSPAPASKPAGAASSGKGTAALKGALASRPAPPASAGPQVQMAPMIPGDPPPAPGHEDRKCATCDLIIEVPVSDPPGGICEGCAAAKTDGD